MKWFKTAIGTSILLCVALQAGAQENPAWQCQFCPVAPGWSGSLALGTGWTSDAPPRFANYRGIDDRGLFPSLSGELDYRDGQGRWFELNASELGTDRKKLNARGGQSGRYQLRFAYQEITAYRGFNSASPFDGIGTGLLTLPPDWVKASQVSGFTALPATLNFVSLDTSRKNISAGLDLSLPGEWTLRADYHHLHKTGTRPFASGVFTLNSSLLPAPVDFDNDRVDIAASWSGEARAFRIGFSSSVFNNHLAAITVQNPFTPIGNTAFLRSALEPDSRFRQLTLHGSIRPAAAIRLSGSVSRGTIRQDGALLPYSINPDFEHIPLPRQNLDQQIDSDKLNLATRLSAKLGARLNLSASMRIDERDNRTPVDLYTPVITDLAPRPETPNRPYSFRRKHYKTELSWRGPGQLRLRGGVARRDNERSLQSVRSTEDKRWWIEGGFNGWSTAQLRLRVENTDRDTTPYLAVNDPGLQENPLMRKFNLASMQRRRALVELDIAPALPLDASLSWHVSDSDYVASLLGLQSSRDDAINLDLAYTPSGDWSFRLFAARETIDSEMAGQETIPWQAFTSDRFTTFGAGLDGQLNNGLGLGLELLSARSEGRIRVIDDVSQAPFPELKTRLRNVRVHATYPHDEHWTWVISAEQEHYSSSDWQIDDLGVDGIPAILAFGQDSPDYHVTVVRLEALYRF